MPEYSSTTITPADAVKVPAQNGATSGNFQLSALRNFILVSKGQANGLAGLGSDGKLDPSQVPGNLDDVLVYATRSNFPAAGTAGKIYIAADTNIIYRWDPDLSVPAYVELSVDLSDYATEAELTNLKNALSSVDHRVQNLESAKGDYVPIDSDKGVISVPSGKGKWAVVEKLRGVSRAENQLVKSDAFSGGYSWSAYGVTYSASDNIGTLVGTGTSGASIYTYSGQTIIAGHKYLVAMSGKANATMNYGFNVGGVGMASAFTATTSWSSSAEVITATTASTNAIFYIYNTTSNTLQVKDFFIRDLTLYFGSTVPTLAEIQSYYPWLLSPSDYGTSLVDSVYEGVRSEGVNIFDEITEVGFIDANGANQVASDAMRSKNYIPVVPSESYYLKSSYTTSAQAVWVSFYDINKTFIERVRMDNLASGNGYGSGVIPNRASSCFIRFAVANLPTPVTYNHDIQICLNSYTDKTTYHPHMESTLSLPTHITLRSTGSVAEEFDLESREKTNPLGEVDYGDVEWMMGTSGSVNYFYPSTDLGVVKASVSSTKRKNVMALGFTVASSLTDYIATTLTADKTIVISNGTGVILIRDDTYSTPWDFKAGHTGEKIRYELATPNAPTQLTPIQNPTILTEAGGTISAITEEPIDGNFSVGFITL